MDILTISTSDANKVLLKDAIPTLMKALKLRGEANTEMTVDIVKTLLQLSFDVTCKAVLIAQKDELCNLLSRIIVRPTYDSEALLVSQLLQNTINPAPQQQHSGGKTAARFASLVRMKSKSVVSSAASPSVPAIKHVMLSYNWGIQPLVKHVDERLRAEGINVWLDIREMGTSLTDSLAEAIENAQCVFVFMTAAYKESPNCRKECEYADEKKMYVSTSPKWISLDKIEKLILQKPFGIYPGRGELPPERMAWACTFEEHLHPSMEYGRA